MDDLEKESLEKARKILKNPELYTEADFKRASTFIAAWSDGRAAELPFTGMMLPSEPRVSHTEEEQ
jgi:hypothetical protein